MFHPVSVARIYQRLINYTVFDMRIQIHVIYVYLFYIFEKGLLDIKIQIVHIKIMGAYSSLI